MFFFAIFLYVVFVHCLKFIFLVRNVHPKAGGSVHNVVSLVGFSVQCSLMVWATFSSCGISQ